MKSVWRVSTTFRRPGNGRNLAGSESQVRRPITTVRPRVTSLKRSRSSGTCHGISPSRPITPDVDCAQIRPSPVIGATSYSDGGFDRRVRIVVLHHDIVVGVIEDR